MKMKERACELCNQQASLYCASDSAFLCWKCDSAVHHANFLVARHRRHLLCSHCNGFAGIYISGASARCRAASPTCRSCSPPDNHSDYANSLSSPSSSSSSACVSSSEPRVTSIKKIKTKHAPVKRIRTRSCSSSVVTDDESSVPKQKRQRNGDGSGEVTAEKEVFVKWSKELGFGLNDGDRVASLASRALSLCLGTWKGLPFKVAAATSFWLGLRFCGTSCIATFQNLSRLEAISGVPTKLILHAHAKLARVFFEHSFHLQEGSDES